MPSASISVNPATACEGEVVVFTFSGTPNAIINYNDGSGTQSTNLNGAGTSVVTIIAGPSNITFTLIDATLGACSQSLFGSATVTISPPPTASISVSPVSACEGDIITFTFTGTPNAIVNYNDGNGLQSINLGGSGSASVFIFAGLTDLVYTLVDVSLGACSQLLSEEANVSVTPLPPAGISANPLSACEGDVITFTFTGTPNATVNYDDGNGAQSIVLDGTGIANISVIAGTTNLIYSLVDVSLNSCTQILFQFVIVSIAPIPSASISVSPLYSL